MPGTGRKRIRKAIWSPVNVKNGKKRSTVEMSKMKPKSEKLVDIVNKSNNKTKEIEKSHKKLRKRAKRKREKHNVELDEASRLQRRTRYLLIKMKLEQNLIDAYSTEGWKGHSREKIKPDKELQRAKKQILKCKLGIREALHELDLLSSVGRIDDSAIAPDGSVYHEHIICAKCKLREAFPDNDIILCDGTCNCAFHQKCLNPPLTTENIPPGDQSWLCKFCDCKVEILEAMNAHLGTNFSINSNWQEIFKEEAALPDGGDVLLSSQQDWPSDDSEDDDYAPENFENCSENDSSEDLSSSSSLWSVESEMFSESAKRTGPRNVDSDEITDCEVLFGGRRRRAVDYRKLYDEMFGKEGAGNDAISEDEDWGPHKRKRKEKESDAATTLMTLCETEKQFPISEQNDPKNPQKRAFFRLPRGAVQKLRLVFAENELPSKAVRDSLSEQLGLESEKVNKWFKNARYLALKARKAEGSKSFPSANIVQTPKNLKKFNLNNESKLLICSLKKKQQRRALLNQSENKKTAIEFKDDETLNHLKEKAKREKKRVGFFKAAEAEMEMERLCRIQNKIQELQSVLFRLPNKKSNNTEEATNPVIYVPFAELREKK